MLQRCLLQLHVGKMREARSWVVRCPTWSRTLRFVPYIWSQWLSAGLRAAHILRAISFFTAIMWSSRRRLEPHYIFARDWCGTAASSCPNADFPRWIDQEILVITVFIHLPRHAAFSISNRHFYLLSVSVKWALSTYAAPVPLTCTYLPQRDSHTPFLPA